ncbi:MAG: hypothetical protein HZC24_04025 [Rhodocyclales bacterium]|nr:hypothetical protein [Rhodocyclales bacterium]
MSNEQDPLDFIKNMWGSMGFSLPGMVAPTLDTDELDKRITDLKTVEGWLKTNLGLLQMTIHGLEMQRTTLAAMQALSQSANSPDGNVNTFANPALWAWPFPAQASQGDTSPASEPQAAPEPEPTSGAKSKKKN